MDEPMARRTSEMGRRLWQQSERDMAAARRLLYPGTYFGAASFAHQAAEKALKAAHWHLRAEEPPWRHDLLVCAALVGDHAEGVPSNVLAAVAELQPVFEASRYPSGNAAEPIPADLITELDAQRAVGLAEEVRAWVQTLLQRTPGGRRRRTRC
jgi:HEPN domain-containing protein